MKHKPHQKEKKALSVTGLLSLVRDIFSKIPSAASLRRFLVFKRVYIFSESGAWLNRDGIAFLKLQR